MHWTDYLVLSPGLALMLAGIIIYLSQQGNEQMRCIALVFIIAGAIVTATMIRFSSDLNT